MPIFEPDLFSTHRPQWTPTTDERAAMIDLLLKRAPRVPIALVGKPEQAGSLEINSSNYRLTHAGGKYLLKRWPCGASQERVTRLLELMLWLSDNELPVPKPLLVDEQPYVSDHADALWNLFFFVEGDYFSGKLEELDSAARVVAQLNSTLASVPPAIRPDAGPRHLTNDDNQLYLDISRERNRWGEIFGPRDAAILESRWTDVVRQWESVRTKNPNPGSEQASHFDLHPHNILAANGRIVAVLDFDACAVMPVGYALGFAGLKLCRQTVVANQPTHLPSGIGRRFMDNLFEAQPAYRRFESCFKELALVEVLRRIFLIMRLNYEKRDTRWNHVLPIQLGHLRECEALFG